MNDEFAATLQLRSDGPNGPLLWHVYLGMHASRLVIRTAALGLVLLFRAIEIPDILSF